jgi:hypothetical protein
LVVQEHLCALLIGYGDTLTGIVGLSVVQKVIEDLAIATLAGKLCASEERVVLRGAVEVR